MKIVFGHRDHRDRVLEPPRQLTERERQLLHLIASSSTEHLGLAMLEQASGARVATECASCPTFGLAQPRAATRLIRPTGVPLGGVAPMMLSSGDQGNSIQGILHIVDGYLTELEFFRDDGAAISALPDPRDVRVEPIR
jgi:hypothetical protein